MLIIFIQERKNIEKLSENCHFKLLHHDVTHTLLVEADQIYNLVCPASPVHYQYDPIKTMKTSVFGAVNMLELAKQMNACIL